MRDSGVLFICDLLNQAPNGSMPHETLCKKGKFWFEMKTIGMNRQYLAKGVNERIDLLVRIVFTKDVRIGQYVVLGNGEQYRIDNVSHGFDETVYTRTVKTNYYKTVHITNLNYTELTLSKIEENYDIEA